jgi:hypothetical protein
MRQVCSDLPRWPYSGPTASEAVSQRQRYAVCRYVLAITRCILAVTDSKEGGGRIYGS